MENLFDLILLQRGDPARYSMPGEQVWGFLILVGIGLIMLILRIIGAGIAAVKKPFKNNYPKKLSNEEKQKIIKHNREIRLTYQSEIRPMEEKLRAYNKSEIEVLLKRYKVSESIPDSVRKERHEEKILLEKEYERFLKSKGHIGEVHIPKY